MPSEVGVPLQIPAFDNESRACKCQHTEKADQHVRKTAFSRFSLVASHPGGAPAGGAAGDGMADNPNATSADPNARSNPNAMSASPNATTAASGSLVGHAEGQQQRSRKDNQQLFHANLL
jgi:hypothetical protein